MKILYLPRYFDSEYYRRLRGLTNSSVSTLKSKSLAAASKVRSLITFSYIDGFFEESLCQAGQIDFMSAQRYLANPILDHDILVLHYRCSSNLFRGDDNSLLDIAGRFKGPKALFIDADEAEFMKGDNFLSHFDLVIKREPFSDLDRYELSSMNKDKIRPTMLSCKYFRHSPYRAFSRMRHKDLLEMEPCEPLSDVFFLGKATDQRVEAWKALSQCPGLRLVGGLLPRIGFDNESILMTQPMTERNFIRSIRSSRVNLAIDGHGQFTFRHMEIWWAGGLLLANSALRDLWLPLDLREGEHYFCYENLAELVDMTVELSKNPAMCARVASAGRRAFFEGYDVDRHGANIRSWLNSIS